MEIAAILDYNKSHKFFMYQRAGFKNRALMQNITWHQVSRFKQKSTQITTDGVCH